MDSDFFERAQQLSAAGQPFVVATVVRVEKPTSARPGARAIIDAGGQLTGWVGGSCAEPVVRRAARQALEDGQPRLLRLTPPEKRSQAQVEGVTEVALACASGGTLEIFIEPQLPQARLVVIGHLPVAQALAGLGKGLGFGVLVAGVEVAPERFPQADRVVDGLDFSQLGMRPGDYVVIASHGNYDEEALTAALEAQAAYVALVASKARGQSLKEYLRGSGISAQRLARVKFPAGLDIGAETPYEIALSILAEIVQLRRRPQSASVAAAYAAAAVKVTGEGTGAPVKAGAEAQFSPANGTAPEFHPATDEMLTVLPSRSSSPVRAGERVDGTPAPRPSTPAPAEARDPVCGMTVEIASARYLWESNGVTYYFCAKSCQRSFEAHPHKYLAVDSRP